MSSKIIAQVDESVNLGPMEIIQETGEILHDYSSSGKECPWVENKKRAYRLHKLYVLANELCERERGCILTSQSRLDALERCAGWLLYDIHSDYSRTLKSAEFCQMRLCPMCCWRRSRKMFAVISQIVAAISNDKACRYIFLTLTIKNVKAENLSLTLDALNAAFQYIVSKHKTFAPAKKFKRSLLGYLKAEEITYNTQTKEYHPHIHVIAEVTTNYFKPENYITQKEWRGIWQSALGIDYDPSVRVSVIRENENNNAVAETAKYPTKLDSILDIKDDNVAARAIVTLHMALANRRLITFGGDFREYKRRLGLQDPSTGDLVHCDDEDTPTNDVIARQLFNYDMGLGVYIC